MNRLKFRTLCVVGIALLAGCGEAPPAKPALVSPGSGNGGQASFIGYADPVNGILTIIPDSGSTLKINAALQQIGEDSNGTPYSAATNTVEVYAPTVHFTSNSAAYPSNCDKATPAPAVMYADVWITSGYQVDQLRGLFAKITSTSAGVTFCNHDTGYPSRLDAELGSTSNGLSLYGALDPGDKWFMTWGINLSTSNAFWFTGIVLSEIFSPARITNWAPADGVTFNTGGRLTTAPVSFTWTSDAAANGTDPEGYGVLRPKQQGRLSVWRCTTSTSLPFAEADCTANVFSQLNYYLGTTYSLERTNWYKWTYQEVLEYGMVGFITIGAPVTRSFKVLP